MQEITFKKVLTGTNRYISFSKALLNGKIEEIEKFINEMLESSSYYDTQEKFFQGYMLSLLSIFTTSNYIVKSNREAGSGRADYLIRKKDNSLGIVIELKVCKEEDKMEEKAKEAIEQMRDKNYRSELALEGV